MAYGDKKHYPKYPAKTNSSDDIEDSDDEDEKIKKQAVADFIELLVLLNATHGMSAKHVCMICHYAMKSGMQGLGKFALHPEAPTGHFQRKLDKALGFGQCSKIKPLHYKLEVVGYNKYDASRTKHVITTLPCHEAMAREMEQNPSITPDQILACEWASDYWEHAVVKGLSEEERTTRPPLPCALYVDGV